MTKNPRCKKQKHAIMNKCTDEDLVGGVIIVHRTGWNWKQVKILLTDKKSF